MTLKDFNKKQLLKMRTAVRTTRALHEKAVRTGKSYHEVSWERCDALVDRGVFVKACPLCEFDRNIDIISEACINCPWEILDGKCCLHPLTRADRYLHSPSSILRLTRWETLIQTEIDARSKK